MGLIPTSFAFWGVLAVVLFWTLGAYNRLVRLRAQWLRALQLLAQQWQNHAHAVRQALEPVSHAPQSDTDWVQLHNDAAQWRPLAMATRQFQLCLGSLLAKPQSLPATDALDAVRIAHIVLESAWQRLQSTHDDLAGAAVPQPLAQLWHQHAVLAQEKQRDYHLCAASYNQAIAQFPAVLLAWLFSFQAAQTLEPHP